MPKKPPAPSQRENLPPSEPSDRLSLDERKQINDARLDGEKKPPKPWQRELGRDGNRKPWQRDRSEGGIERKPKGPKGGGRGGPS